MPMGGVSSGSVGISPASNLKPWLISRGEGQQRHYAFFYPSSVLLRKTPGEVVAYRLVFEPQEVAKVEIAVAQRHGGVALLEVAPRRAHLVPYLQVRRAVESESSYYYFKFQLCGSF